MKIAAIGGGGFRTPVVYQAVGLVAEEFEVEELMLQDPSAERLHRIADVIRGMREESGGGPAVSATTSLDAAVENADFIFAAVRVGGLAGRILDETIPLAHGVLGQETVGPGGIAFALRTLPVMDRIAAVVRDRAPEAWFLNFTNPAGLVTEALAETLGVRVVGICDSPAALCARVAVALGRSPSTLEFGYAGLNHLGWLAEVRSEGQDLLPDVLADDARLSGIEEARLFGAARVRELGMIPNEYVTYYEDFARIVDAVRRTSTRAQVLSRQQDAFVTAHWDSPAEALASWRRARDLRHGTYMAEVRTADGEADDTGVPAADEGPGAAGYAAVAAWFVSAASGGAPANLILNLPNGDRMPDLPRDAVIEAPVHVDEHGVETLPIPALPHAQNELIARVKHVERLTIRAARESSAALALEAVVAHPLVPSREIAELILGGFRRGHPELRESLR